MSEAVTASAPRPIAPPSAQEVQRKLGSPPTLSAPTLSSSVQSNESQELQRRLSSASRRPHGSFSSIGGASMSGMSSADEDDAPASPNRSNIPLSAISEAEDGNGSGSDSDASSVGGARSPTSAARAIEKLRISRESTRLSESVAVKSGYLMKKGERRKAWKKRWFVLRGGQVAMYKSDKEYRLLRLIPLTEIHTCAPIELKKHAHTFGIVTPKRTYYVKADSDAEVKAWCAAVEQAKREVAAASTKDSLDGPSRDSLDTTPHASVPATPGVQEPTPAASPLQSPRTAAIPIPTSSTGGLPTLSSNSYATTTTSPSPPAAFSQNSTSVLSSSFTSVSTNGAAAPGTIVPPNSFAAGGAGALGLQNSNGQSLELALGNVDAGLERIAGAQGRSPSFSSDAGLTVPHPGYFGRSRSGTSGASGAPTSPGGGAMASSSEEDDGFDEAWSPAPQQPTTPGGLTFVDNKPPQQQQQQASRPGEATGSGFGDPNKVILSGYLMKQGKRKTWRKRWFVLMSGRLMYSRSHMDAKIHRQIPLALILDAIEFDAPAAAQSSNSRRPLSTSGPLSPSLSDNMPSTSQSGSLQPPSNILPSDKNYEHCFKIITPKRTYLVCAPTEEDEIKWLAALQCLVARKNQPQQQQASTSSATTSPPVLGAPISSPPMTQPSGPPPTMRRGSSNAESGDAPRGHHTRQRSVTDAARAAVMDVERRFHPQAQQQQQAATSSS